MKVRDVALVGVLSVVAAHPAVSGEPAEVVVLFDAGTIRSSRISLETFLLALGVQLAPYGQEARSRLWHAPGDEAGQRALARQIGRRQAVRAVVWYSRNQQDNRSSLVLHVLDLAAGRTVSRSIPAGSENTGIERSMAAAVRTLLHARVEQAANPPVNPDEGVRSTRPERRHPNLRLGVAYGVESFAAGGELRHGPQLFLTTLPFDPPVSLSFLVSVRVTPTREDELSAWSRTIVSAGAFVGYGWLLGERWYVRSRLGVRLGWVRANARDRVGGREEGDSLWEFAAGFNQELGVNLGGGVGLDLMLTAAWLPLEHQLSVRGAPVAESGPVELGIALGVHMGFW